MNLYHRLSVLGTDASVITKQLGEETDVSVRRALMLSLGEFNETDFRPDDRKALLSTIQELHRSTSDSGLHAASEWLLRKWGREDWLAQANEAWAKDAADRRRRIDGRKEFTGKQATPQWYVNSQGQTMAMITGPVEFRMGSPASENYHEAEEQLHKQRIGRSFAIACKPVTLEEYRRLTKEKYDLTGEKFTRDPRLPVVGINWHMAATYCNLLSREEGIPEDQWCYEMAANGLVKKMKENYLSLTGYRLPTEAEMEYSTRAGADTSRFYGETDELLIHYAWYVKNSGDLLQRVGEKKPNDFGLFDTNGNCYTWCQEAMSNYPASMDGSAIEDEEFPKAQLLVNGAQTRVLRGGSYSSRAAYIRSAYRDYFLPVNRSVANGLRPVRTLAP